MMHDNVIQYTIRLGHQEPVYLTAENKSEVDCIQLYIKHAPIIIIIIIIIV